MRKSLDGEAIDGRSHSLDKDQLDFALNFDELDLVFAFASPQIFQNTKVLNDSEEPDYQKIELLNHREEFKIINNTLIDLPTAVVYKKVWATRQNFENVLLGKPKILHFSGHGEQDKGNGDNDFLIIEKEDLRNENITGKMIREMFSKNKEEEEKIRLAVVPFKTSKH